jgi:hypothetical protein|tara:strand:+ start:388 stop:537 length:150 start_codon:yes stop_codon:yes gene_type:complete
MSLHLVKVCQNGKKEAIRETIESNPYNATIHDAVVVQERNEKVETNKQH